MAMIPESERSPQLRSTVKEFLRLTVEMLTKDPDLRYDYGGHVFTVAHGFWTAPPTSEEDTDYFELQKARLKAAGFDGDRIEEMLQDILSTDIHLEKCCGNTAMLSSYLGTSFLNAIAESVIRFGWADDAAFEAAFDNFCNVTYAEPFRTEMFCHLFNFDSEINEFQIGEVKVRRYSDAEIRLIFNNPPLKAVFHPEGVGNVFASKEIAADRRDPEAYQREIDRTFETINNLVGVLQFAKDGMVTQDYRFLRYSPIWVNRLFPTFPVGEPRRFPYLNGTRFYSLGQNEIDKIETWAGVYSHEATQKRLEEQTNLGKQLLVAIEFYTSSFDQKDEAQRLIHLMVSLEALFSPDDQRELSYRIRQYASQLVGMSPKERLQINKTLRNAYNVRSKLVHGGLDLQRFYDDTLVTPEENEALASIIRKSILKLLACYLKGRNILHASKGEGSIHADLEKATLDESAGDSIRAESDVETFVNEFLMEHAKSEPLAADQ